MTSRCAFVTGARGCIARAVRDRLHAEGFQVRGVDLEADPDADVVAGDISAVGSWQTHTAGCDVVVHTAAAVSNVAAPARAWDVNVRGTRNVLDAAVAGGATRFVHFSSAAVYGHHRPAEVDERYPVRTTGSTYGDTKIAAEQVVLQSHAAGEIAACVLRPSDVYGPGSRPWTILPVEMLRRHQVLLPARGRGHFNAVYVDDVAEAVLLASTSERAAGEVFNVAGGPAVETSTFFGHYARMLGLGPAPATSTGVAVLVAEAIGRVSRALGLPSEASAATMRMLAGRGSISIDKARRVLGYEPRVELAEGMRSTEDWLREQGYLDGAVTVGTTRC